MLQVLGRVLEVEPGAAFHLLLGSLQGELQARLQQRLEPLQGEEAFAIPRRSSKAR